MEFISDYGLFLLKTVTIVVAIIIVIGVAAAAGMKKKDKKGDIVIDNLNEDYDDLEDTLFEAISTPAEIKKRQKSLKNESKSKKKSEKKQAKSDDGVQPAKPRRFVVSFDGDVKASQSEALRHEVTAILTMATPEDEVVVRLESPGGMVHGYGYAASQLSRIRAADVKLTVCVDKVAASGGYMMACLGNQILAAPFALVGSIGVIAQVPNFNRLLKKNDIDIELHTAGKFKRTLTMLGENTEEGREKFREELEEIHYLFKEMVHESRPSLDIESVATGEAWYGKRALELNLVDALKTSDEYLFDGRRDFLQYSVTWRERQSVADKLGVAAHGAFQRVAMSVASWLQRPSV